MSQVDGIAAPAFQRYWRAAAVSGFGTYVTLFALQALVVLTLDGSASDVGWLNAARWLPYVVLGLAIGAWVDGRRRLPLMVYTDAIQAILLLLIPLMWGLDALSIPVLWAIVFAYGTAALINNAASMSFLPRIVGRSDLQPAHARIDGADAVSSTVGPGVGGALVSAIGAPFAVVLDSLTYIYSALTLRQIDVSEPPVRPTEAREGLWRRIGDGVRWSYGHAGLAALSITTHGWFVGHAIVGVVLAPFAFRVLGLSAFQFGLIGAIGGIAAVVGAVVTTRVGKRLGTAPTIVLCRAITTVAVVTLALSGIADTTAIAFGLLAVGQALYGLSMGMSNSHEMSYRQMVTPDEFQARTNTTLRSINRAVIVIVAPIAGVLADSWGMLNVLWAAVVVFALCALGLGLCSGRLSGPPSGFDQP